MKYKCEKIQDLLPLSRDDVCSDAGKKVVEEHLEECGTCKHLAEKLKKQAFTAGLCISGLLVIPIIVCLICNIATSHTLDWFFVVLASLMVFASLTVVPLMLEKNRGIGTLITFTISLILLLLVCCLFTNGNWFWIAVVPFLFGMSVFFLPYVLYSIKLPACLTNKKALIAMTIDTIWLYTLVIVCGMYALTDVYLEKSLVITSVSVVFAWILFLIVRYLRCNALIKAGICVLFGAVFDVVIEDMLNYILYGRIDITISNVNLLKWEIGYMEANIHALILAFGILCSMLLIRKGIITKNTN